MEYISRGIEKLHKFYSPRKFKIAFCRSLLLRIIPAFYQTEFLSFSFPGTV